jgi:1-acyl-sn-glycerol-3-phosphate acyltransferase
MKHLRSIFRIAALIALTASLSLLLAAGRLLLFASSKKTALRWRNFIFRTWARGIARLSRMKITLRGKPPQPPFLLVSNHLSYIDVITLAAHLDCVFIAKKDVSRWPAIGFLCRQIGTIFIDRENRRDVVRVNQLIEKYLDEGRGVVLFAEGTSTAGSTVAPFNPSLLERAARRGFPVSYAALSYRAPRGFAPAHLSVCWWGDMTFADHLFRLFQLPSFEAMLSFGAEAVQRRDRRLLADELWQAVKNEFIPVVEVEETCSTMTR